jgi:hypothetical protein
MQLLRFSTAHLSSNDLGQYVARFSKHMKGVVQLRLCPDSPTYYFTLSDAGKLQELILFLRHEGVEFDVVTEADLPLNARRMLGWGTKGSAKFLGR